MKFAKTHTSLTVKQLLAYHQQGKLNLNPGFQRQSVWKPTDQRLLIDTLLRGMPLPNLFFWERKVGNKIIYDVIDGKQRIEALLAFAQQRVMPLTLKFDPEGDPDWANQDGDTWSWKELQEYENKVAKKFLNYEFPVVQIAGSLPEVEKVFVRINSTGKQLSAQEVRNAKWYQNSPLLVAAHGIAKTAKYDKYFVEMGVLSEAQLSRMKAIELIVELMLTIQKEDVLDRKKSIDKVMAVDTINGNTLKRLTREVKSMMDLMKSLFPDLKTSRFSKASDFYSLFFVMWKLKRDGYVAKDPDAAQLSFLVLNELGLEIAQYRTQQRAGQPCKLEGDAKAYFQTIMEGTDSAVNRRARNKIIEDLLTPIYKRKDPNRAFSKEQKQLLWGQKRDLRCPGPDCNVILDWRDVHVDHVMPHSKGGATTIENGRLLCSKCNLAKGAKLPKMQGQ